MDVRRSWLFVPGHEQRKVQKASSLGADVVVLDLEDSVPPGEKEAARELVAAALTDRPRRPRYFVRINATGSGYLSPDLEAVVPSAPDGLVLPKVERPEDVLAVDGKVQKHGRHADHSKDEIQLVATIESAKGVINAPAISACCAKLVGLLFGGEDFAQDIGLPLVHSGGGDEMVYARSAVVVAAASERLQAVDRVYTDIKCTDGLRKDAEQAVRLGFAGKAVIHPQQIQVVNEVFRPSSEELAWAQRVLQGFESALGEGRGAVSVEGQLVDRPIVERARRVVQLHQFLNADDQWRLGDS